MFGTYKLLRRPWRGGKALFWTMPPELAGTVACLALFGIEQPDLFRSRFWQIGYENGFNSNPNMILYAYANHRPLPKVPFVWSQTLTDFNVAISILSLFLLIVKMAAAIMHVYVPLAGTFIGFAMTVLYLTSMIGQIGPDHADPRYPSNVAWYIVKDCDVARSYGAYKYCLMAKWTLAVTVYMVAVYTWTLGHAIWSMWPDKALDTETDEFENVDHDVKGKGWEMQPQSQLQTPGNYLGPLTPRTQAFHTLDRGATHQ